MEHCLKNDAPFLFVRPAWRLNLEVQVLYEPGKVNH